MNDKLKIVLSLIKNGKWSLIFNEAIRRFTSTEISYCLRRDLNLPFNITRAKIPIRIREMEVTDLEQLFDSDIINENSEEFKENLSRKLLLNSEIKQCFVAVDENDKVLYMQWLISHKENDKLQEVYRGGFAEINTNEMLLEGAYTLKSARGKRIMSEAMATISSIGKSKGAKYLITYVKADNIPSLKGCQKSGYRPYKLRKDRWFLFMRKIKFITLPVGTKYNFEE